MRSAAALRTLDSVTMMNEQHRFSEGRRPQVKPGSLAFVPPARLAAFVFRCNEHENEHLGAGGHLPDRDR